MFNHLDHIGEDEKRKRFLWETGKGKTVQKGCRTHLNATTGARRCLALMPGILVLMDTLLSSASCGSVVDRLNLSKEFPKNGRPHAHSKRPPFPPLSHTAIQQLGEPGRGRGPTEASG